MCKEELRLEIDFNKTKLIVNGKEIKARDLGYIENCKVEGCKLPSHAKGYCKLHYSYMLRQIKKGLDEEDIEFKILIPYKKILICNEINCNKQAMAKGYCKTHYNQFKKGKELVNKDEEVEIDIDMRIVKEKCKLDFCNEEQYSKGYCKNHYYSYGRYKRRGMKEEDMVFKPITVLKDVYVCKEKNCEKDGLYKGFCRRHHRQLTIGKELELKKNEDIYLTKKANV